MTQALYYKPSFDRLRERIEHAAPALDVILMDEEGGFSRQGTPVARADVDPHYFWIHGDLFFSPQLKPYFNVMLAADSARWLHTINTGLDQLPYLDLLRKGITVSNNHSQAIAIAEYVMAQVLARYQDMTGGRQRQHDRTWKHRPFREIMGTRWVIVGFGHIGQEIAARARAFGVHITAIRRSPDDAGLADAVTDIEHMAQALSAADVVVLACASNDSTRGLVDSAFLEQLKPGAVLVNIARGDLVVEADLRRALDGEALDYAILDVLNQEPPAADMWVWDHPRVSLTPHSSNAGSGMRQRSDDLFIENLQRITLGEDLLNVVREKDII